MTDTELQARWEQWKKDGMDVPYEKFLELMKEDEKLVETQKKREESNDMSGSASDAPEHNAKCYHCGNGLSAVEYKLYGNRCVFCAPARYGWEFFDYLIHAIFDRMIYLQLLRLANIANGDMLYTATLGNLGYTDINQCREIKDKKRLLRELKRL